MNWDFLKTDWVHERYEQWEETDSRIAQIRAETDACISRSNAESDNRRFESSQADVSGIGHYPGGSSYPDNDGNDGVASWP